MSSAQKKSAVLPALRFSVLEGGRGTAAAGVANPLTVAPKPVAKASYHGLHLITDNPANDALATAKVDSFAQARRIVAQVEREIEQQAERERTQRMRGWPSSAFARTGVTAPIPAMNTPAHNGFARIRRFFGF